MLGYQGLDGLQRILVQAVYELPGKLRFRQAFAMGPVSFSRDSLDLLVQFFKAGCHKQHLGLSKILQLASGFASADPALVSSDLPKPTLQLQVVLRQPRDVITVQQFWAIQLPTLFQRIQQTDLCPLDSPGHTECSDQLFDCLGNLPAAYFRIIAERSSFF